MGRARNLSTVKLTLARIRQLEHELHILDVELDGIAKSFVVDGGGSMIQELNAMHADAIRLLAQKKRELLGDK